MKPNRIYLWLMMFVTLFVTACAPDSAGAAQVIEDYYEALATKDAARLTSLSCAAWEAEATAQLDGLIAVDTTLQNLQCEVSHTDEDTIFVTCTGTLNLTYEGEVQQLDLAARSHQVVFEAGEWRMCGFE